MEGDSLRKRVLLPIQSLAHAFEETTTTKIIKKRGFGAGNHHMISSDFINGIAINGRESTRRGRRFWWSPRSLLILSTTPISAPKCFDERSINFRFSSQKSLQRHLNIG